MCLCVLLESGAVRLCKVPAAGRNTLRIPKGFTRTLENEATFPPLSQIAATLRLSPFGRDDAPSLLRPYSSPPKAVGPHSLSEFHCVQD